MLQATIPAADATATAEPESSPQKQPEVEVEGDTGNYGVSFMAVNGAVPATALVCDSGSNVNCTFNENSLTNVVSCLPEDVVGIGGGKAYFRNLFDMFYDPQCPVNIVSLATLCAVGTVNFNSATDDAFVVLFPNDDVWRFENLGNGLYFYDTVHDVTSTTAPLMNYSLINTVRDNELKYHRKEVELAKNE